MSASASVGGLRTDIQGGFFDSGLGFAGASADVSGMPRDTDDPMFDDTRRVCGNPRELTSL
jgi:hypothetical protein